MDKYPGLAPAFGELFQRLQREIQFPPPRNTSRLLPLLPESSVLYVALSNYGDAAGQALTIFNDELQKNPALRNWWLHSQVAETGPKIEDLLKKFHDVSQYLGDEIVLSAAPERREPNFFILAEARKPGLKNFLQDSLKQDSAKSQLPVRVLDLQELAAAQDRPSAQQFTVLVRPDFVVAALDLHTLRNINIVLSGKSQEFPSTPFGQRLATAYEGGVTTLGAADLHAVLSQAAAVQQTQTLQRTGFANMKYLVWQHTQTSGQQVSQMELSFTGPRHGVAAWLGPPKHPGSLDFVSPKALMVANLDLTAPTRIFDDLRELSQASHSDAFLKLAQMETVFKVRLKEDLLTYLTGEITTEIDNIAEGQATWKLVLGVTDTNRLQHTLDLLQAATQFPVRRSEENGVAYYHLRVPSSKAPMEIAYTFADGYLIIGSSHETAAEAIHLHKTGESLGNSSKLPAALPPEHPSGVSALIYQDPIAMSTLQMQRLAPEMASSLSQFAGKSTPAVICAYGEETAIRTASTNAVVDAGAVLVAAAIAVPNLLRARTAANEASAVGTIRTVNTAQVIYASKYPQRGFARDLATLGPAPGGPQNNSAQHAGFLDVSLGNPVCTAGVSCEKSGYRFTTTAVCKQQVCSKYVVVATPVSSNTGSRNFCSTSDGVIRSNTGAPLKAPIGISECQTWTPIH